MTAVTPNRTLLQKADLAVADLTANGLLVAEQAAKFLAIAIKRAVLLQMITVETMKNPTKEINKLRFAGRVLRRGQSGQALNLAERSKPDLGPQVTLTSVLIKGEVRLNDEVLEDNIERGTLKTTVMQEFGKAAGRDLDELFIQGDTASADNYLNLLDGIIKQATSNVNVAGGISLNKDVLRDTLKSLPIEFMFNKADMRFLTSVNAEIDYRDSLSNRQTDIGDKNLTQEAMVGWSGIPVVSVPLFPENLGGGTNETVVILTDPENIHAGFQRAIKFETDRDITSGEWISVVSLRGDVKYAHEPAVAKSTGVTVS